MTSNNPLANLMSRRDAIRAGSFTLAGVAVLGGVRQAFAQNGGDRQAPVDGNALRDGATDGTNPTAAPDAAAVATQMKNGGVPHLAPGQPGVD